MQRGVGLKKKDSFFRKILGYSYYTLIWANKEGIMRKLVGFVMVGLAFIGLQVAVAGAQTSMPPMGDHSGMPPMGDHSGMMAPPTGAPAK